MAELSEYPLDTTAFISGSIASRAYPEAYRYFFRASRSRFFIAAIAIESSSRMLR